MTARFRKYFLSIFSSLSRAGPLAYNPGSAMLGLLQDLRYAVRQLWKHRPAAAVVMITIALGIGVNTAVFSIVNGFQRPLPAKAPHEIVVLAADTKADETGFRFTFSYAALQDIRRRQD